jgi:hypothetical protein
MARFVAHNIADPSGEVLCPGRSTLRVSIAYKRLFRRGCCISVGSYQINTVGRFLLFHWWSWNMSARSPFCIFASGIVSDWGQNLFVEVCQGLRGHFYRVSYPVSPELGQRNKV